MIVPQRIRRSPVAGRSDARIVIAREEGTSLTAHSGRRAPLGDARALFDLPEHVAYFNTANMSPMLRAVADAGIAGVRSRAAPWTITAEDWFSDVERLRSRVATLMDATPDAIALVPSTSYGLAIAARNVPLEPGDHIMVLAEEYPSNYYTWSHAADMADASVVQAVREPGQSWTDAVLGLIDERTAVVAVPNVHWTDGSVVDLEAIGAGARAVDAAVVVDASQSLGAMPLDLAGVDPDFVVSVGYKWLLGPFSVGYLYVADRHQRGQPIEHNWILRQGAEDFARLVDYTDEYQPGARRYDVGQRTNFGLVPMAIAAVDQLIAWSIPTVSDRLAVTCDALRRDIAAVGLDVPAPTAVGPHMFGVNLPRHRAGAVLDRLGDAGVIASIRGASLRISPHLHTTNADIDRLVSTLRSAV